MDCNSFSSQKIPIFFIETSFVNLFFFSYRGYAFIAKTCRCTSHGCKKNLCSIQTEFSNAVKIIRIQIYIQKDPVCIIALRDHIFATFGNVYIGVFSAVINSFHRGYTKYEELFNTNYIYQLYKYIYYININTNYKDTTLTEYLYEPRFFTIFFYKCIQYMVNRVHRKCR